MRIRHSLADADLRGGDFERAARQVGHGHPAGFGTFGTQNHEP